jgi:hypothetical protein
MDRPPPCLFLAVVLPPSSRTFLCSATSPKVRSDAPVVLSCVLLHRRKFVVMPPRGNFCQLHCPACYRRDPASIPGHFMWYKSDTGACFFFRIFRFYRVSFGQPSIYCRRCVMLAVHHVVLFNTPGSRFWSALGLLTKAWSGIQLWPRNEGVTWAWSPSSLGLLLQLCAEGDMVRPVYVNHTLLTRYDIRNISLIASVCLNGAVNHTLRLCNAGRYEWVFVPSLMYLDLHQGRRRFQGHLRPR